MARSVAANPPRALNAGFGPRLTMAAPGKLAATWQDPVEERRKQVEEVGRRAREAAMRREREDAIAMRAEDKRVAQRKAQAAYTRYAPSSRPASAARSKAKRMSVEERHSRYCVVACCAVCCALSCAASASFFV